MVTIFDIETGALPWEQIEHLIPEEIPAESRHSTDARPVPMVRRSADYEGWKAAALISAALSPLTAEVLAIGRKVGTRERDSGVNIYDGWDIETRERSEAALLHAFWQRADADFRSVKWDKWNPMRGEPRWVGFNSHGFDLPFLLARTQLVGRRETLMLAERLTVGQGKWPHRMWLDLRDRFAWGARLAGPCRLNLDTIAKALGLEGKPKDGTTGADFARLYHDPETREKALEYLRGDINMTWEMAWRLVPEIWEE